MIREDSGQVALEYLFIFAISLILLVVFTLPLAEFAIEDTFDVSDTLTVKSQLAEISQAIGQVYGEGQGSKQTINIVSSKDLTFNIANSYVSTNLKLKDGSNKNIKVSYKSTLAKTSIPIKKGVNRVVVEWSVGSENMKIYKK